MWEKVLDADIEDALSTVRLGDSLELGTFLSYDLLKGRYPNGGASSSKSLIFSLSLHSRTGKKRQNVRHVARRRPRFHR